MRQLHFVGHQLKISGQNVTEGYFFNVQLLNLMKKLF